jgi:nucleoside-diphosphate-sugar epimerase
MNIIITGGAGFVGRNLVRILASKNHNITVLDKSQKNLDCLKKYNIKTLCADLAQNGEWSREFEGKDVVINLEAQISSPEYDPFYRNNILATKNVIEAARKAGVKKFIHFSSAAVLSIRKDDYAKTKLEGEELVRNSGLEYCILQPSIMYGPTDDKNIGFLINFAKRIPMFPIPGHGKWPRQPIYIDDMCFLIISIMNNFPHNKVYSINGKDVIFYRDMIKIVLTEIGGFKFRLFLPISLFKFLMMSYQKLTGNIQFTPDQVDSLTSEEIFPNYPWWDEFDIKITSFEEGVRRMME